MSKELDEFLEHFRSEVLPHLKVSQIVVMIVPGEVDVKFAVELGAAVMLDKPTLAVIRPGTKIPEKLSRVVDRFVELDLDDPNFRDRFEAAARDLIPGK